MMSFGEAVKTCLFEKIFVTSDTARRSEFWWFVLFCHLIETCIFVGLIEVETAGLITMDMVAGILLISYLLLGIPLLTAFIRRLHDTGHTAWSLLWLLVPYLGWFILLIWALKPGYTYAISRDYNDDLDCADYDSACNRISKPRYEECFDHNDEEDFDYPTDEEDDYEDERRRRREEREEYERNYENERRGGEIDRERELYEECRRMAADALNEYEHYKAKAEDARRDADSRLSSAKRHEYYAKEFDDETHRREAEEAYSWAEQYSSEAKENQKEADKYYEKYKEYDSKAYRHSDNLRRLGVYV